MRHSINYQSTIFTAFLLLFALHASAQKKVAQVTQSALTGISIPVGSQQDARLLTVAGAELLLNLQCSSTKFKNTEVLSLPPVSACGYNADSLVTYLTAQGWSITPDEKDNKYVWLQKDNRYLFAYFYMAKKRTDLYIAEAETPPATITNAGYNTQQAPVTTVPAVQQPVTQQTQTVQYDPQTQQQPVQQTMQQPAPTYNTPGSNGILVSTTNFDDGWAATPLENWVRITKENATAFLHYGLPIPDNLRSNTEEMRNYYWNTLAAPRYQISSVNKPEISSMDYTPIYFMEADGTDNATGSPVHIAFRIIVNNGVGNCVEIVCPSKADYDARFPTMESVEKMPTYNKFALSDGDLSGNWQNTNSSYAQYYNVYSGNYAGMAGVSINDSFVFNAGSYQAEHKGASGMVGNQQFFQEKENGTYQVSHWEINTTDQQGKTKSYNASYQAVKNGRILNMQNKQYSGMQYHLIKTQ
jgi:hypothetical protein